MSIENHPNLHVIALMMKINSALDETLRGNGLFFSEQDRIKLARILAEKAEKIVDEMVYGVK